MKIAKIIRSYDKKNWWLAPKQQILIVMLLIHSLIYSVTYLFGQQILLSTSYIFNNIQSTEGTEMKMRQKSLPPKKKKSLYLMEPTQKKRTTSIKGSGIEWTWHVYGV